MKQSSGTLLIRKSESEIEVLLVHPSGKSNQKAKWSIPKGCPEKGETLEEAARRETLEETGVEAKELTPLGFVDYSKRKKRVHCFSGYVENAEPYCASWEVDRAEFVDLAEAKNILHHDQVVFIDRLQQEIRTKEQTQ